MGKYATKEQLTALVADMASKINIASGTQGVSGSYVPIGCIEAFMGVEAPPDFLVCDGSLQSIAAYPQLADHFYEQFGASNHFGGNGTTTFAVPDLRGEFLRGTGTNNHTNQGSGANVGEHQDGTRIPMITASKDYKAINMFTNDNDRIGADFDSKNITESKIITTTAGIGGTSTSLGAYTSRPTNTSVLWCIKAIDTKFDPEIQMVKYSTDEQLIGKWIDGKRLYQKTIDCGAIPSGVLNGQKIYSWLNSNIESVFVKNLFAKGNSGTIVNMPSVNPNSNGIYGMGVSVVLDQNDNELKVLLYTGSDRSSFGHIWVTVCYTKSTD